MATTSIPFWQFSLVSALGIIYECAVFAYFGRCVCGCVCVGGWEGG